MHSCLLVIHLGTNIGTTVGSFFGGVVVGCLGTLLVVGIVGGLVMYKKKSKTNCDNVDKGQV